MPLNPENRPVVLGSLNSLKLDILGSGLGFVIGDLVNLASLRGREGIARVANVGTITGALDFELIDGGYGYTTNSQVLISEKIITSANINLLPQLFEQLYQPLANLHYLNANGDFVANTNIFTYHANGLQKGTGLIITVNEETATNGYLFVEVFSGSLNDNNIFTTANAITANLSLVDGYTNLYATGNVIGWNTNSGNLKIGLKSVNNVFLTNHFFYTVNGSDTILNISLGSGGNVSFSNNFIYEETTSLVTDKIAPYVNVGLGFADYGFPATVAPSENVATPLKDAFTTENVIFGTIQFLLGLNPGINYNEPIFIFIYEPLSYIFQRHESIIQYANADGLFFVGEVVNQNATSARGLVKSVNSSAIYVKELRVNPDNYFSPGFLITGESSSLTANVIGIIQNTASLKMGFNAIIDVDVAAGEGAVTELQVIKSGFGFVNDEIVTFSLR